MKRRRKKTINKSRFISLAIVALIVLASVYQNEIINFINKTLPNSLAIPTYYSFSLDNIPEYDGKNYVIIDNNEPNFQEVDMNTNSFETYSDLDALNRCGAAYANISKELMPTEKRESIGSVRLSSPEYITKLSGHNILISLT